jgi:hypothetical protein
MEMSKKVLPVGVAALVGSVLVPMQAMAAISLPSADILADIALVVAFISLVGGAVLGMHYVAKAFGWARKSG